MILSSRPDFLTIQIKRIRQASQKNADGTIDMGYDVLANELIQQLFQQPYEMVKYSYKAHFMALNKQWLLIAKQTTLGITLHGGFFLLNADWKDKVQGIMAWLINKKLEFHITRCDWAYYIDTDLLEYFKRRSNFKKLVVVEHSKNKAVETVTAKNGSSFEVTMYDKTKQILTLKKKNLDYFQEIQKQLGTKQIYNFEIRLKSKDQCEKLKSLITEKINWAEIEAQLKKELIMRVNLPPKIRKEINLKK